MPYCALTIARAAAAEQWAAAASIMIFHPVSVILSGCCACRCFCWAAMNLHMDRLCSAATWADAGSATAAAWLATSGAGFGKAPELHFDPGCASASPLLVAAGAARVSPERAD